MKSSPKSAFAAATIAFVWADAVAALSRASSWTWVASSRVRRAVSWLRITLWRSSVMTISRSPNGETSNDWESKAVIGNSAWTSAIKCERDGSMVDVSALN